MKALQHRTTLSAIRATVLLAIRATNLEHPHARRPVVIKTFYPIITTNPSLPSAAYKRRSAKILILI